MLRKTFFVRFCFAFAGILNLVLHLKRSFKSIASVGFAFAKLGFALQNLEAMHCPYLLLLT